MTQTPYSPESRHFDAIGALEIFRKRILVILAALVFLTVIFFMWGRGLMEWIKRPLGPESQHLIFIEPMEAFTAYLKVSFFFGILASLPLISFEIWAALKDSVPRTLKRALGLWLLFCLALFVIGMAFAYAVLVPAALKFLLAFGEGLASASLTLGSYVSFVTFLVLMGGAVFEIPAVMAFLTHSGILRADTLRSRRRAAWVFLFVAAAVITPTQDPLNLVIFAVPMVLLYELGLMISGLVERRRLPG